MKRQWHRDDQPDRPKITLFGWILSAMRAAVLVPVLVAGLLVLLLLRLIEGPIWGKHRPITPFITQGVCRYSLLVLGIRSKIHGKPMAHPGAWVANHSSWVDIFVLNATSRLYFVSKAEVASWPGIGWLARATGTLFIQREKRQAKLHGQQFQSRLLAGHRLLFFPEGTSTDGSLILPFKSTLFAAFFAQKEPSDLWVQPIRLKYTAPAGQDHRFYGWWGDMDFAPHAFKLLAFPTRGRVDVYFADPLKVVDSADRKALAEACEKAVRSAA